MFLLVLHVCLSFLNGPPVSDKISLLKHIEGKVSSITSDQLQNLYVLKNDVLEKYDANGKFLYSYSDNTLGRIDFVDASDPMKTLVFYKAFPEFLILDNTLTVSGPGVPLQQYGLEQVSLACTSYDRGYWFYNPANLELVHLTSDDLVANKTTGNISSLLNEAIHPNFLVEQNNRVFLNDSAQGVLVFDIYGAYYKTIPIKGLNQFQVSADQIIYLQDKSIRTYNFRSLSEDVMPLSDPAALAIRVEKERLYILTDKGVDIYAVKQ